MVSLLAPLFGPSVLESWRRGQLFMAGAFATSQSTELLPEQLPALSSMPVAEHEALTWL